MKRLTTALLAACAALGAYAATTISGDFTIDHTLDTTERPLVITGDATITVAADVTTSLGSVTNNGYNVTINLESGAKAGLAWLTVRGNGTTTINFNGGVLTDGGGWDTPWFDTASGTTVALVSVDGNPISFLYPNAQRKYWNRNRAGGTPGRVTTSGSGRCDLQSSSVSGDNTLSLRLTGCTSADWGHTGGTYFGYYNDNGTKGYLWCEEADVLPPGDIYLGTYGGRSPVELNLRGHSQTVERLHLQNASSTVVAGSGTPALTFSSANARIDSTCAATAPVLSIPAITVAAGATLTVDKVAVTAASSFSNLGTVAYANGGSLTATVGTASDTIGLSATAPLTGATRLVKNGTGAYSYAGDAALDVGALTVSAGEFRLSGPRGTTNRWWKFTIKHRVDVSVNTTHICCMRLFGSDLKPADGVKPDTDYPNVARTKYSKKSKDVSVSSFAAYDYSLTYNSGAYDNLTVTADSGSQGDSTIGWGQKRGPQALWNDVTDAGTHIGCEITYPYPQRNQPAHWITWTYRIPEGRPVFGYNLRKDDGFWNYPVDWSLASSADGVTWETMDEQTNYQISANGWRYWFNGAGTTPGAPTSLIDFGSQVKPTLPTTGGLSSAVNIKVASDATFDASLVTGGQEISTLTVDYAGGGTLKGVKFATSGTVYLQNVPVGTNLNEFAIPLTFEDVVGTPVLANWTVQATFANGIVREKKIAWDNGRIVIRSSPFVLVVR